ncbi:MAG: aminotransferase class I/II-fold pyridoxal phosphate-dependent enzyme [Thermoplasmata archaeon]|jgi:aspartate/methionine/tyrosine aminotransferase
MYEPYFETGRWIISHRTKLDLSNSGLSGRIDLKKYFENATMMDEDYLKEEVASLNNTDRKNIVITHGATEALFMTITFLRLNDHYTYHVRLPEYEPIFKLPELLDLDNVGDMVARGEVNKKYRKFESNGKKMYVVDGNYGSKMDGRFDLLLYSNINNPTGWFLEEMDNFRTTLVDETFLQFYMDLDNVKYKNDAYRINTYTKFYGGDEVRVGWIIAPTPENANKINSMKGIFTEQVSRYNISVAYRMLRDNDSIREFARYEMQKNLSYLRKNMGRLRFYGGREPVLSTVTFVDYSSYSDMDSVSMAEYLHSKGISIVPGKLFGVDGPYLRVCYTRENFQEVFDAFIQALEDLT